MIKKTSNPNTENQKIGDILRSQKANDKKLQSQTYYNIDKITLEYFNAHTKPFLLSQKLTVSREFLGAADRESHPKFNPFIYKIDRKLFYKICDKYNIKNCASEYLRFFYALSNMIENENLYIWDYSIYIPNTKYYKDTIKIAVEPDFLSQISNYLVGKIPGHIFEVLCNGEIPNSAIINIPHAAHDRTKDNPTTQI